MNKMENINKIQIVPDEVYEIGADKAPVIPEWSVKDDSTLYEKVRKLAHSTFDASKFTVVGSPSITSDGVASGFSSSNYIESNTLDLSGKFSIKGVFNYSNSSQTNTFFASNQKGFFVGVADGKILLLASSDSSSWNIASTSNGYSSQTLPINTDYVIEFGFNGSKYYVNVDGVEWVSITSSTAIYNISTSKIDIGWWSLSTSAYLTGSIDLKQFSITVDGVEVFSGNKTGIDTIKPDDYTIVGTPTISADGILSNISRTNLLYAGTLSSSDFKGHSWEVISPILDIETLPNAILAQVCGFAPLGYGGDGWFQISINANGTIQKIQATINTPSDGTTARQNNRRSINSSGVITADKLQCKFSFDISTGTYSLSYNKFDGNGWILIGTDTPVTTEKQLYDIVYSENPIIIAGIWNNDGDMQNFDLNGCKFYIDGDLVCQPCLKIPYTEGKGNKKVVDKLYRDRVKDLFEQEGYNIYYTLGEDDFTLPSNKPNDIVKYKADGLTVAEQRADQTLTIRGACESGTDVNLPMDFFDGDSYAVFGVGTTGTNTASKFTPAADGNYIAIGKGKV